MKFINLFLLSLLFLALMVSGCAKVQRIQSEYIPENYSRLGEIVLIASKEEILKHDNLVHSLSTAGLSKMEIQDGNVAIARIFCCGGPNETKTALEVYVPSDIQVDIGDIVEIKAGRHPKNGDNGKLNTVVQIKQKNENRNGTCQWDPPDERLWVRVLKCDWMESEGWVYESHSLMKTWVKAPNN